MTLPGVIWTETIILGPLNINNNGHKTAFELWWTLIWCLLHDNGQKTLSLEY